MYHRKELATAHYQWEHRMLFNTEQKMFLQTIAKDSNVPISEILRRLLRKEMEKYNISTIYAVKNIPYRTMVSERHDG